MGCYSSFNTLWQTLINKGYTKKTLKIMSIIVLILFVISSLTIPLYGRMLPEGEGGGGGGGCTGSASTSITCGVPPYTRTASCSVNRCCGLAEAYPTVRCVYCYCNGYKVAQSCC